MPWWSLPRDRGCVLLKLLLALSGVYVVLLVHCAQAHAGHPRSCTHAARAHRTRFICAQQSFH